MKDAILFLFILLLLFIASCKKDNPNQQNQSGVITFNFNGVTKTTQVSLNTVTNRDTLGVQQKVLIMGPDSAVAVNSSFVADFFIYQTIPLPGSTCFNIGSYTDFYGDTACWGLTNHLGCNSFLISYVDFNIGALNSSGQDSSSVMNITSCSVSPNLISGTFKDQLTDGYGNYYQVTNGKFTNIPYTITP